jgi:hypothetical protein
MRSSGIVKLVNHAFQFLYGIHDYPLNTPKWMQLKRHSMNTPASGLFCQKAKHVEVTKIAISETVTEGLFGIMLPPPASRQRSEPVGRDLYPVLHPRCHVLHKGVPSCLAAVATLERYSSVHIVLVPYRLRKSGYGAPSDFTSPRFQEL